MDSERLKLVLVCGLVILLIALIIWTASVVKSRMSTNRTVVIENNRIEGAIAYDEAHATSNKYWYNKYDMDSEDEIDRLKAKHYFNDIKECIDDLIIEMYDCGFVHTEELYTIAYGKDALTPDAPIFKVYGEDAKAVQPSMKVVVEVYIKDFFLAVEYANKMVRQIKEWCFF